jgi:DHA1 family tetracycline resistance protein-like MFS transporter
MKVKTGQALTFIFITLLIDITGMSIIIPVIPKLIEQLTHTNESEAAAYGGELLAVYAVMQFLFAPTLGNLSDRYGRRPVLLFSLFGFSIDYLLQGFAPSITWLFIGRAIAGFTGASFSTASAYIADVSTPEKKAQNFGLIGAAFGLGFIIGPLLGAFFGHYGPRIPFFVAAGLSLLNAVYGYFILPESLPVEKRRPFNWSRANPVGTLVQLKKYPAVTGFFFALFFLYMGGSAVQSVWSFWGTRQFGWDEKMIGISLGVVGLLVALVQGMLIRKTMPLLGHEKSIIIGNLLMMTGVVLFAFASETWQVFVFLVPYALGGIAGPAIQGYISNFIPPDQQGELQGGLTSLMSITLIFGPLLMTWLFAYYSGGHAAFRFNGMHYLAAGLFFLISTLLAARSFKKHAQ